MVAADPTRRQLVLAVAAALPLAAVSGCGALDVLSAPPPPSHGVRLLQSAIAAEELMVDRYRSVLSGANGASAALATALEPLLAQHQEHLAQLRSRLVVPPGGAASASPSGSPSPGGSPVPAGQAAAVAFLKAAEQAASTAMLNRLPHAPGSLAQLFASISASEATHVPVLTAVGA